MEEQCSSEYWDKIFTESNPSKHYDFWRVHLLKVLRNLFQRWSFDTPTGIMLKTDLYEEATSQHHLLRLLENCCEKLYGMDISPAVVCSACQRAFSQHKDAVVVADVRNLEFKTESFDKIISTSTLDHFTRKSDIATSLSEFYRALKRGGIFIVTLDNPHNPVIFLRNILPYRLLKKFNLISYAMGVTLSQEELISMLELAGFKVISKTFVAHTPRLLIIWGEYLLSKIGRGKLSVYFNRIIYLFEHLQGSFLARFSGYFVAVKAVK